MADVKEKINLLDVIPFRSENITAEKGSDGTVTIAFPRFKYERISGDGGIKIRDVWN